MAGPSAIVIATRSVEETQAAAGAMAGLCVPGDVLLLAGDLGSGKTTFAQGFGRALGVVDPMTSPTFTLVRQYQLPGASTAPGYLPLKTLFHADVYRLDHLHEISDLGLGELVEDGGVALVEWGDMAEPILGVGALSLRLEADTRQDDQGDPENCRTVTISWSGPPWAGRSDRLAEVLDSWTVET